MIGAPIELMGQNIFHGPAENVGQATDSARFVQIGHSKIQAGPIGDKAGLYPPTTTEGPFLNSASTCRRVKLRPRTGGSALPVFIRKRTSSRPSGMSHEGHLQKSRGATKPSNSRKRWSSASNAPCHCIACSLFWRRGTVKRRN
jgi:hypothetical protein